MADPMASRATNAGMSSDRAARCCRLVVIGDAPGVATGLSVLLPLASGGRVQVVGHGDDAGAAAGLVGQCRADAALVDVGLSAPGGLEAIAAIKATHPRVLVIALSSMADGQCAAALCAGAQALLRKTGGAESLVAPVLVVLEGWAVVPRELLQQLLDGGAARGPQGMPEGLTVDDRRLWGLVAAGMTAVEIGETLHVSERTAKRLIAGLIRQLGVSSRIEAAAIAGRIGLDSIPGRPERSRGP